MVDWISDKEQTFYRALELGKSRERKRIIKLLEEQDWLPSIKTHIIALIKGEK